MRQLFHNQLVGAYIGQKKKIKAGNVGLNEISCPVTFFAIKKLSSPHL